MWALHKPEDHKSNYRASSNTNTTTDANKANNQQKSVSFSTETKDADYASSSNDDDGPSIEVHKSLLHNAKSYLAQFQDFQDGGAQSQS